MTEMIAEEMTHPIVQELTGKVHASLAAAAEWSTLPATLQQIEVQRRALLHNE